MTLCTKILLLKAPLRPMPITAIAGPLTGATACNTYTIKTTSTNVPKIEMAFGAMGAHSLQFKVERYFAVCMLPLFPLGYYVHLPPVDFLLSAAIVLHSHWGIKSVIEDYARPIVVGETFAKIIQMLVFPTSLLLLAGLFHFNSNDVGLTRAFEMFFSL